MEKGLSSKVKLPSLLREPPLTFQSGLPEMRMILQLGFCFCTVSARVIPSIPGIVISLTKTSGRRVLSSLQGRTGIVERFDIG